MGIGEFYSRTLIYKIRMLGRDAEFQFDRREHVSIRGGRLGAEASGCGPDSGSGCALDT